MLRFETEQSACLVINKYTQVVALSMISRPNSQSNSGILIGVPAFKSVAKVLCIG